MTTSPESRLRQLGIVAVLVLLTETAPLELSLVFPAAHSLTESFDSSGADAVTGAVSLAAVVCIPLLGRIADVVGKKRVLLWSGAVFAVGSLLCATAGSLRCCCSVGSSRAPSAGLWRWRTRSSGTPFPATGCQSPWVSSPAVSGSVGSPRRSSAVRWSTATAATTGFSGSCSH